ncbi:MAG: hypothetical protein ACH350_07545 [Parachlamydiaceae bacterium]
MSDINTKEQNGSNTVYSTLRKEEALSFSSDKSSQSLPYSGSPLHHVFSQDVLEIKSADPLTSQPTKTASTPSFWNRIFGRFFKSNPEPLLPVSPSNRPSHFDRFDIQKYLEEVKNVEIEQLLLEVAKKNQEIQQRRKVLHFHSRALMHDTHHDTSLKKADLFQEKGSFYLHTAGVICQVAAMGFHPALKILGDACARSADLTDRVVEYTKTTLEHRYNRIRDLIGDYSQAIQATEKEHEASAASINQIIQNSRRQAELLVG